MNTAGIIILIAVLLFCIYELVTLSVSISKKVKAKKNQKQEEDKSCEETKNEKGGIGDDRS